jgi:hypothetical protein
MSTAARIDELRNKFEENPRRYFAPLANELRKAGHLSEAIALCREFLPKQPEHMSGYIVFGQALYESGDLSEARIVFEQALALDPENLKALRHLGDIAKWEGDTAGARRWYERVLEADPRNDDIAAQLATLVTPMAVIPVVPEPEPSRPTASAFFEPPTPLSPPPSVVTPPFSLAPMVMGAIPTPDAGLRAVDFDEINARLRAPAAWPTAHGESLEPASVPAQAPAVQDAVIFDLDAIEAAGGDGEPRSVVEAADDPFGFSDTATEEDPFEEGLLAPEWPDTSALVARIGTPRTVTPLFVSSMTPDAVAAFGLESTDPLPRPALDEEAVFVDIEEAQRAVPREVESRADGAVDAWVAAEADTVGDDLAIQPSDDVDEELPWLAPAPDREPIADVDPSPFVDSATSADDGRDLTAAAAAALPEVAALFGDDVTDTADSAFASDSVESSFVDVMPEEQNPAFVTETMGELLVSQGFTARAASVYEELVRRRPYDPVLTARLAELQERLAADAASVAPAFPTPAFVAGVTPPFATPPSSAVIKSTADAAAVFDEEPVAPVTARERFARLATRRVPRRTPPRASVAVDSPTEGLASLFGGDAPGHDDLAARALADAFAPFDGSRHFGGHLPFEDAMLGGAARPVTPLRSVTPIATAALSDPGGPFSFDRFFPDPATSSLPPHTPANSPSHTPAREAAREAAREVTPPTVSDDLAQFSAWLKGLGNP